MVAGCFWKSRSMYATVVATAGLIGPTMVNAQEAPVAPEPPPINNGAVSLSLGADITTHYYFRGVLQEDQGVIVQPYAEVGFNLFSGDGQLNSVDLTVGTWSSLHSEHTLSSGTNDIFYETDYYVGVSATVMEKISAGITYYAYTSPNGAFATVQEIDVSLGYDDTGLIMEDFALSPYILFAFEIDNSTAGAEEGIYMELGIEPSFTILESEDYPVTLSIPIAAGFNLDNYYSEDIAFVEDGDFFGYAKVGATVSVPLAFIPAEFGAWEGHAGVDVYFMGDDLEAANNGDDIEIVGRAGFSMSY